MNRETQTQDNPQEAAEPSGFVSLPTECGCEIATDPSDGRLYEAIYYCPLHKAAPKLLEALERVMEQALTMQEIEERLTQQGAERRELGERLLHGGDVRDCDQCATGESLRHRKAAQHEVAFFDWMLIADNAIYRHTMLDALMDAETWAHLQRTLAGEIREAVEDAKDETITRFFETYEAGQR